MRRYVLLIRKFFSFGATDKNLLIKLIVAVIFRTIFELLIPLTIAFVVDAATEGNYQLAGVAVLVFLMTAAVFLFARHLNYNAYAKNADYIHDSLQRKILNKIITFDQDYTKKISHAEVVNIGFNDVTMCQRIPDYLFELIIKLVSIFADAIILVVVDPLIGGITLGLTLISSILFVHHMKMRDHYSAMRHRPQDEMAGLFNQVIEGRKEVHSFNLEYNLKNVLDRYNKEWGDAYSKQRFHNDLGKALTPFLQGVGRILAYVIAGTLILQGEYNVAMLVLVMGYYENMHDSYDDITEILYNLSKSTTAINRVHRLLNYKPPRKIEYGEHDNDDIRGKVEFKNVSFTYGRKPLMKDVSFIIEPCSLTGIVGKSGSGKSTIFRLLLRLYKPTRGKIFIDDKNIKDYNKEVYITNVSIVNQKPFVFDLSIRENLNMVDPDPEHQIAACKKAGIHDFIMRLEKGYDTILVSDGANLSAGHKQLLSLARTLLSKSEVLLFDEVTSALDSDTTKQIINVLKTLKKDHTVLVITHKPEVMRAMDELIVIDDGRMVGRGTHKNLLHNKYYQLLQK